MRRLLWITTLCGLLLSACSKDEEDENIVWDFWSYNIVFSVVDAEGRDLLDPAVEGNILDNDIRIHYDDRVYATVDERRSLEQGALALRHGYDERPGRYVLAFGRFSPRDRYLGQTFAIDWGDGTRNEVAFDCYIEWRGDEPFARKSILLDGVPTPERPYLIRLVK